VKVNIYETVEVSDEQRVQIARLQDGDGAKKRQATRDEIKTFVWEEGSNWEDALDAPPEPEPEDESLFDDGMDLI
jgi:uncharacterized Zn finger protein